MDTGGPERVDEPGGVGRIELCTAERASAKEFHGSVPSRETRDVPMGEGLVHSIPCPAGGAGRTVRGGIRQPGQEHRDAGSAPERHPYVEVEHCDAALARAAEAGAAVIIPAVDAPGVGRIARVPDPFGTPCAVVAGGTA
ncbi:hypothetical protein AB0469_02755 [Streptomyces sp. NPDC093801]|uniref:hypothetical protein n=1 Tax=Streptomyces sp. NPDC093801 TaxID=3155203 RepID=UPI0034504548